MFNTFPCAPGTARPVNVLALVAAVVLWVLLITPSVSHAEPLRNQDLKVYVSLPMQGENASTSRLILKGLRASLRSVGSQVNGNPVRLVVMNDAKGARWRPTLVRRNARRAVGGGAIAYVGELNSEATAVAQPILKEAGVSMFAPVATSTSLTPSGRQVAAGVKPNLFRAIPNDRNQATALAIYLKRSRVKRALVIDDGQLYGKGLGAELVKQARARKIRITHRFRANQDGRGRSKLVRRVARLNPQAVVFTGSLSSGAIPLFKALNRALPKALLFGGDALAHDSFARKVGPARSQVRLTRPAAHTNPRNQRLRRLLSNRPDAVTVFSFDGMNAILDAIRRARPWDQPTIDQQRARVRKELFAGRLQNGAVSRWLIRSNGDSTKGVFDAIRLGKMRVLEPVDIAAHRYQRKRHRTTPAKAATSLSSVWERVSSYRLTTFEDLEEAIRTYPNLYDTYLDRVLRKVSDEIPKAGRSRLEAVELNRRLAELEKLFVGRSDTFTLPETEGWKYDQSSASYRIFTEITVSPMFMDHLSRILGGTWPPSWTKARVREAREAVIKVRDDYTKLVDQLLLIEEGVHNRRNELLAMGKTYAVSGVKAGTD